jgi:hypothetical protein
LDYNVLKGGMVMRDGLLTVADDIDFCVLLEPDGMSIRGGMATWFLRDGTTLELTCEPIDGVVFNIHERIGEVDSICRVSDGHDNVGFCNLLVWNGLHRIAPVLSSFGANIDEGLSHRGRKQPRPWPTRWTAGGGHV